MGPNIIVYFFLILGHIYKYYSDFLFKFRDTHTTYAMRSDQIKGIDAASLLNE